MNAPICDFVKQYSQSNMTRFHMPGHKGCNQLGFEEFDITEIKGADSLFDCNGIIKESEENCTKIFETEKTVYSTGGSTLCIQSMLYLAGKHSCLSKPAVIAARNAHKAFINACGLLGIDVVWITPQSSRSICECIVTPEAIDEALSKYEDTICGVYITSPDYLGNISDIEGISKVCRKHSVPLLCDNAHGSYLKFLKKSQHPIDLGADICCDSAHKTLPVLTGGAYLHIAKGTKYSREFAKDVKQAMSLFGSTSPSYLTLCSLDYANILLSNEFRDKLAFILNEVSSSAEALRNAGYEVIYSEPLKITILPNSRGRTGIELAEYLRENGFECEYSDYSCVVLMLSPYNKIGALTEAVSALSTLPMPRIFLKPLCIDFSKLCTNSKISIRAAVLSKSEMIATEKAVNRICAKPCIACPPGIPICISGEIITESAISLLLSYGIDFVDCVIE